MDNIIGATLFYFLLYRLSFRVSLVKAAWIGGIVLRGKFTSSSVGTY